MQKRGQYVSTLFYFCAILRAILANIIAWQKKEVGQFKHARGAIRRGIISDGVLWYPKHRKKERRTVPKKHLVHLLKSNPQRVPHQFHKNICQNSIMSLLNLAYLHSLNMSWTCLTPHKTINLRSRPYIHFVKKLQRLLSVEPLILLLLSVPLRSHKNQYNRPFLGIKKFLRSHGACRFACQRFRYHHFDFLDIGSHRFAYHFQRFLFQHFLPDELPLD